MSQLQQSIPAMPAPPPWNSIAARFPDERDCLASFLALEGAEVVAGVKPGNLLNISNRQRPCGRNPYKLWRAHGETLLAETGLSAMEMEDRGDALLLYIYRRGLLRQVLKRKAVSIILEGIGYSAPGDIELSLAQLQRRVKGGGFPHEIGIFLGYPLKDVLAFMGRLNLAFACQGPWKMYGNPSPSLRLAAQYRESRCRMAQRLCACNDPLQCLGSAGHAVLPPAVTASASPSWSGAGPAPRRSAAGR